MCQPGNGNPPQYSCLENPIDRGAGQAIVRGVAKESDTTEVTWHSIGKRSQPEKATYCMIPIIRQSKEDKTIEIVKGSVVARGTGSRRRG